MDLPSKAPSQAPIQIPKNPTDKQRHEMIREALLKDGRPEDYQYLVKSLSPPPDITTYAAPGQYKGIKVAVVGAGVAGLATAFELRKLGFDITMFEPEDKRIGGRIYTHYFDKEKKLYGELGAGRIPASHGAVWHYINLFGLNTSRPPRGKSDTFVYIRGVRARNNPKEIMEKIYPLFNLTPAERNTPWPELYEQVIHSAIKSLSPQDRANTLKLNLPGSESPQFIRTVVRTVRQALIDAGLSNAAIRLITSLLPEVNAFIQGSFYTELVTEYALSTKNSYRVDGGMVNLPLAFYKSLSSENPQEYGIPKNNLGKVTFKMGSLVIRCYKSDKDRKVVLRHVNIHTQEEAQEAFDYVFFTIPLTALRKIYVYPAFSNLFMAAIREVNYIDAQKTLFLCSERFWEKQGITGGMTNTDLIIQSVMYPSDRPHCQQDTPVKNLGCSPDVPGVLTASYNMGNDAIRLGNFKTRRIQLIKRQLEIVHGLPENYLENVVLDHAAIDWNSYQWVTGGFVNFQPGQGGEFFYEMFRPEYENRVYFAGEAYYPPHGWIQASLQSAMIAANALVYYLKSGPVNKN